MRSATRTGALEPDAERREAGDLIETRLKQAQSASWEELNKLILIPRIEEVVGASGANYLVKTEAWYDMEQWASGLYVEVHVYPERSARRPYRGVTERGGPDDPVPDPPEGTGWFKRQGEWWHPAQDARVAQGRRQRDKLAEWLPQPLASLRRTDKLLRNRVRDLEHPGRRTGRR